MAIEQRAELSTVIPTFGRSSFGNSASNETQKTRSLSHEIDGLIFQHEKSDPQITQIKSA